MYWGYFAPSRRRSSLVLLAVAIVLLAFQQAFIAHRIDHIHPNAATFGLQSTLSASTTVHHKQLSNIPTRYDNNSTFSACLLVADDNHYLIEWLAYHYHTLPLRYLVIARDPRSRTSPKKALDRWEQYMTIVRWNDKRFMPKEWVNRIPRENDPIAKLMKHRERQRHFYPACFEHLKQAGRQWVMVIDVDELVVQNVHCRPQRQLYPHLLAAIQHEQPYNMSNTSCITMPRLRFGNYEDKHAAVTPLAPYDFQDRDFLTYHFRWRAGLHSRKENRNPKSMIRVDRILNFSREDTDAHRPVRSECPKRNMYILNHDSPFSVHHYVGSREQFLFRNDARQGTKTRSEQQLDSYGKIHTAYDDTASQWLPSFIKDVGIDAARTFLEGVGNVSYTGR